MLTNMCKSHQPLVFQQTQCQTCMIACTECMGQCGTPVDGLTVLLAVCIAILECWHYDRNVTINRQGGQDSKGIGDV